MSMSMSVRLSARQRTLDAALLLAGILFGWTALGAWWGADILPSPWATVQTLFEIMAAPDFARNAWETLRAFLFALAIAFVVGVTLGMLLGAHRLAGDVFEPVLMALYSIPKISLYPVILLAFGLGLPAKVAFGVIHGVVPVAIFTIGAVRNIPRTYFRTAGMLRMSPWRLGWRVLMPAALPEIVAGLRIGFSLTLLGTLIGEMFASQYGLGQMLMHAIDRNQADHIMALSLLLFTFAVAASLVLLALDKRLRRGLRND
ncbi:Hydroxymethylpyrimidine ABC transporter, transmembrane component [plant metagenome]|uniref:Hydroxymethylpyrimidine ABC transporter, transmembrane component n=1 Tax=plant metagenome TaxID=1297885 RepID=A0A484T494_9ZZZZ